LKGAARFWSQVSAVLVTSIGILSASWGLFGAIQVYRWLDYGVPDLRSAEEAFLFLALFVIGIFMIAMGIIAFLKTKRSPE
jgi:hypothetical protein